MPQVVCRILDRARRRRRAVGRVRQQPQRRRGRRRWQLPGRRTAVARRTRAAARAPRVAAAACCLPRAPTRAAPASRPTSSRAATARSTTSAPSTTRSRTRTAASLWPPTARRAACRGSTFESDLFAGNQCTVPLIEDSRVFSQAELRGRDQQQLREAPTSSSVGAKFAGAVVYPGDPSSCGQTSPSPMNALYRLAPT